MKKFFTLLVLVVMSAKIYATIFGIWVGLTEKGKFAINPII